VKQEHYKPIYVHLTGPSVNLRNYASGQFQQTDWNKDKARWK